MNIFAEIAAIAENHLMDIPAGDLQVIFWGAPKEELEKALDFYQSHECYIHCSAIKNLIDWETWKYSPPF